MCDECGAPSYGCGHVEAPNVRRRSSHLTGQSQQRVHSERIKSLASETRVR